MSQLIEALIEYVTYSRKSNGRKAVPRQKALIAQMIRTQGGVVLVEFTDRDSTAFAKPGAARPKRDDFDRMLAFLSTRTGLRIGAYHADRLLRNGEDTAALIRVCAAGGHLIETHSGGVYDLSTANGRRRLRDDASAAEFEVDHNTERVIAAKDEAAAAGLWLGGRRPLGWETDPAPLDEDGEPLLDEDGDPLKGVLRLVPAEADAIRQACADVLAGGSANGSARKWNAAGITGTSGAKWTGNEVRRVLQRPRNAGLMEHRGQVTGRASWPEIVDEPTWRAVCAVLADPRRRTSPGPERRHLLSGIARCGNCGTPMVCTTTGAGRGAKRTVYRCRRGVDGENGHVARDARTLDGYIASVVIERLARPDAEKLLLRKHESDLPELYRRKAALEAAMQASNDLRRQGLLTPAEFSDERREHQRQTQELDDKITTAEQIDILAPMIGDPVQAWETRTLDQKRAIIDTLMTLVVRPQPKGRPKGWTPGTPYFDPAIILAGIEWKRG
jgi:DNA invertase Pin-like site-specific DNA recombinase